MEPPGSHAAASALETLACCLPEFAGDHNKAAALAALHSTTAHHLGKGYEAALNELVNNAFDHAEKQSSHGASPCGSGPVPEPDVVSLDSPEEVEQFDLNELMYEAQWPESDGQLEADEQEPPEPELDGHFIASEVCYLCICICICIYMSFV